MDCITTLKMKDRAGGLVRVSRHGSIIALTHTATLALPVHVAIVPRGMDMPHPPPTLSIVCSLQINKEEMKMSLFRIKIECLRFELYQKNVHMCMCTK
mmetsp:Transcript_30184/g.42067  ORF Transcript_30184/g.42067 Transcript_30184/m.42067 type:complete len:98 (-) Transcript_30184:100-393(-)